MEENQRLKFRHKEELKDHELSTTREIHRLKESSQTTEESLKEQVTKLEAIRTGLERVSLLISLSLVDRLILSSSQRKSMLLNQLYQHRN